jgi:hypothetical protein
LTGKRIDPYSSCSHSGHLNEILILPGTRFIVASHAKHLGLHTVELEEVIRPDDDGKKIIEPPIRIGNFICFPFSCFWL